MTKKQFRLANLVIALGFTLVFGLVVVPAFLIDLDIIGGFAAGFVNPYSSGYSADVFFCYAALLVWVIYEAREFGVRYGWICLLIGIVPGVAVGMAAYLIIRSFQVKTMPINLSQ